MIRNGNILKFCLSFTQNPLAVSVHTVWSFSRSATTLNYTSKNWELCWNVSHYWHFQKYIYLLTKCGWKNNDQLPDDAHVLFYFYFFISLSLSERQCNAAPQTLPQAESNWPAQHWQVHYYNNVFLMFISYNLLHFYLWCSSVAELH